MIASLVVAFSFIILSSSLVYLGRSKEKTELTSSLVSLESQIQNALANPENYPANVREQLSDGQVPSFNILVKNNDGTTWPLPASGTAYVSKNYQPCGGFAEDDCWYQVNMNFTFLGSEPSFSYNIQINPAVVQRTPLSTMQIATSGQDDYQMRVPSDFYKTEMDNNCADEVAVRGLNRATGVVNCIRRPSSASACAPGTFPKRLYVENDELKLECSPPAPAIACPPNYSISRIETQLLDRGTAQAQPLGQCQWTARPTGTAPGGVISGGAISGEVCPINYYLTSRCSGPHNVRSSRGICRKHHTEYPEEVCVTSGSGTSTTQTCTTDPPYDVDDTYEFDAAAGSLVDRTPANGRNIDCAIVVPAQGCPGDCNDGCTPPTWDADAHFQATCQLNPGIPETVDAR